jgi:hypothetical protein
MAWESEQGFCVKAVWEPAGRISPQLVLESLPDVHPVGRYTRTVADWSSSQNDNNNNAWSQRFSDGNQNNNNKNNEFSVRAVRGFTQEQTGGETRTGLAQRYYIFGQALFLENVYAA